MSSSFKNPEMHALEQQWRKQTQKAATARRGHGYTSLLSSSNIDDLKIPTLPATTILLIEMCHDINTNYDDLAKIIETDPGMAARILKLANSAHYGQSKQVATVLRSVTVLGLKQVRTIGLSYKLTRVIKEFTEASFDFEAYWEQSLIRAVLAKEVARQRGSELSDEAFLAGLLQDIGIVILRTNQPEKYQAIINAVTEGSGKSIPSLERETFGMDHAKFGEAICSMWNFPDLLVDAIRLHHTPIKRIYWGDRQSEMHAFAYAASIMPGLLTDAEPWQILSDLKQRDILQPETCEAVLSRSYESLETLCRLFDDCLPKDTNAAQLLCQASNRLKDIGAGPIADRLSA